MGYQSDFGISIRFWDINMIMGYQYHSGISVSSGEFVVFVCATSVFFDFCILLLVLTVCYQCFLTFASQNKRTCNE